MSHQPDVMLIVPAELVDRVLKDLSILDTMAPKSFRDLGVIIKRQRS